MSFNRFIKRKNKGAAALITLIIISTVLLLSGITLVLNSIDLNKSLKGFQSNQLLYIQSRSCLEDALSRLQLDSNYSGTITLTSNNLTCQSIVTTHISNPNYRDINLSVNDGEFYLSEVLIADITTNPIEIVE